MKMTCEINVTTPTESVLTLKTWRVNNALTEYFNIFDESIDILFKI